MLADTDFLPTWCQQTSTSPLDAAALVLYMFSTIPAAGLADER